MPAAARRCAFWSVRWTAGRRGGHDDGMVLHAQPAGEDIGQRAGNGAGPGSTARGITVPDLGALRPGRIAAQSVPADRRLRVPVRLREHLPDLVGRFGGVDVRAAAGLPQRVRRDPGPRRRALPARAVRGVGAGGPALPAGQPDPGDHLADPHRLGDRARRPGDGALARPRGAVAHAPAHPDGLGRRAHPAAHRALRQRHGRTGDELRAVVRLRPGQRRLGVLGQRLRRGDRAGRATTPTPTRRCG